MNDDSEDLAAQYFIAVEQKLMMESSNIFSAVYYVIAAHYIFNLSYHSKANFVLLFLQEKILGLQSPSVKRTLSISTHFTGITRSKQIQSEQPDEQDHQKESDSETEEEEMDGGDHGY